MPKPRPPLTLLTLLPLLSAPLLLILLLPAPALCSSRSNGGSGGGIGIDIGSGPPPMRRTAFGVVGKTAAIGAPSLRFSRGSRPSLALAASVFASASPGPPPFRPSRALLATASPAPPNPRRQRTEPLDPSRPLPPSVPALPDMSDPSRTLYEKMVRRLYMTNLFHPVKLGLDNIDRLHEALGRPMDRPGLAVIHIAGTNGKGSVALKIAKALEMSGGGGRNTVGLFISPHISSFRERMQVDSVPIAEAEVEDRLPRIFHLCEERGIPATFFEVATALAFLHFAESGCNVVVLETGLGGRLDATNVVREPALSVITSIGLEHTRILGDTVEEIALEKGGIIKEGRPVLVGPNVPHTVLRECAEGKGAGGYHECHDVLGPDGDGDGGVSDYDAENTRTARAALELVRGQDRPGLWMPTEDEIADGTACRPPCRFEVVEAAAPAGDGTPVRVVLDVAHNPDAMEQLVAKLGRAYPDLPKRIVCGFSSDKDLAHCGRTLLELATDPSSVHLVEAFHPRAARLEDMLVAEPGLGGCNFDEEDRSLTAQIASALALAAEGGEMVVVCGSVFLMAEAREALGYDEPRDSEYIAEVAGANLRYGQENFADTDPDAKGGEAEADGTGAGDK